VAWLTASIGMKNFFPSIPRKPSCFIGDRDVTLVRELNSQLQFFRDWLTAYKAEFQAS
jgi:hypothetical protein